MGESVNGVPAMLRGRTPVLTSARRCLFALFLGVAAILASVCWRTWGQLERVQPVPYRNHDANIFGYRRIGRPSIRRCSGGMTNPINSNTRANAGGRALES